MLEVYSKDNCPQCKTAIAMITAKGIEHKVLKLDVDYTKDELLAKAPQTRTLPVVFLSDRLIGGLQDLQRHLVTA